MQPASFAVHLLTGLAYSMLLFLLAAGLSLVFGMMDILNLAHGSFFLVGAYLALSVVRATGSFWVALAVVPILLALMGIGVERILIRPLKARGHLAQALGTLGLAFMLQDAMRSRWGADALSVPEPALLSGSISVSGYMFPIYRLFLIAMGLLLGIGLWLTLERTRIGAIIRAGVADREMCTGVGIPIDRVFAGVFALGLGLAGISGVLAGPFLGASPGLDFDILIMTLIVVTVSGLGSISGTFWGSLVVGLVETLGRVWFPETAVFLVFALMAFILLTRPAGLFQQGEIQRG